MMNTDQSGGYYPYGAPAPQKPKKKMPMWLAVIIGVIVGLCCLGTTLTGVHRATTGAGPASEIPTLVTTEAPSRAAAPVAVKSSSATKAPAKVQIDGDDLVHIGEDAPAGTYRAAEALSPGAQCYWQKSSDAEGENIISNDIPVGGRPQVTLKKGQWFSTQGCPTWVKK